MDVACFDVAVLGAGVQGSATAYYLARKSGIKKVLLLEQVRTLVAPCMMMLRSGVVSEIL